jgi:hypothetical protein
MTEIRVLSRRAHAEISSTYVSADPQNIMAIKDRIVWFEDLIKRFTGETCPKCNQPTYQLHCPICGWMFPGPLADKPERLKWQHGKPRDDWGNRTYGTAKCSCGQPFVRLAPNAENCEACRPIKKLERNRAARSKGKA